MLGSVVDLQAPGLVSPLLDPISVRQKTLSNEHSGVQLPP